MKNKKTGNTNSKHKSRISQNTKRKGSGKPPVFISGIKVTAAYNEFLTCPPCPVFEKCGGCQLQMYTYEGQLKYKFSYMIDLLGKFGKIAPVVGMDEPWYYRNKTHATFRFTKGRPRKIIAGIYEEESHHLVPTDQCMIQDERATNIVKTIVDLMPSFKMEPYDEDKQLGFLRHTLVRTANSHNGVMVVLVGNSPIFPAKRKFVEALIDRHPEIETVIFNINQSRTSMVLGPREETLFGKGYLVDELSGKSFRISPKSFYQVNTLQTEKLYQKAIDLAGLTGDEIVLDTYSGIGTIGMIASKYAKQVIGVELNKDAVKDAIISAKQNKVDNIYFYQADATEFMVSMSEQDEKIDVVFMDPPRNGSTDAFIDAVSKLSPKRIVYISCGPESLARDLERFKKRGYGTDTIYPFDMFPQTVHVETVVLLEKK